VRVLVDTSVWVHHLNRGERQLAALLEAGEVLCHPFIIGELACGRLNNRLEILNLLAALPQSRIADHDELLHLIDERRLFGRGLGWIDIHLLGSGILSSCELWTSDKALDEASRRLGIAANIGRAR
jgi:predicted nucleic acid-binding protein